jgi:hypothetical protein
VPPTARMTGNQLNEPSRARSSAIDKQVEMKTTIAAYATQGNHRRDRRHGRRLSTRISHSLPPSPRQLRQKPLSAYGVVGQTCATIKN